MAPFGRARSHSPSKGHHHHQPLQPYRREDYRPHEYGPREYGPGDTGYDEPLGEARQTAWAAGSQVTLQPLEVVDLHPSNFNHVVLDPARTVIVAFYAPWCKAVEVETLLTELQHDLAGEFDIVLGRVDADMYKDIFAHFNGSTLPAIFIFPMNEKRGMEYTGPRNKQSLIEYIIFHHRGEVVHVPRNRRRGPKRSDFHGTPAPVAAPPKKEDYPYHPFEFYIPPPPPALPEAEAFLRHPRDHFGLPPAHPEFAQPPPLYHGSHMAPYPGMQSHPGFAYPPAPYATPMPGASLSRRHSYSGSYTRPLGPDPLAYPNPYPQPFLPLAAAPSQPFMPAQPPPLPYSAPFAPEYPPPYSASPPLPFPPPVPASFPPPMTPAPVPPMYPPGLAAPAPLTGYPAVGPY